MTILGGGMRSTEWSLVFIGKRSVVARNAFRSSKDRLANNGRRMTLTLMLSRGGRKSVTTIRPADQHMRRAV